MSYSKALERLYSLRRFGMSPGLDGISRLLDGLGHPERAFRAIHIAGSNGKGSTAALIESILRASGHRTGLYTSPHLCRFTERIRIAGEEIDRDTLASWVERVVPADSDPTFFDATTAIAFAAFAAAGVEIAVIETGLGGRLDSTNVFERPLATVVTGIALEHTEVLGGTLSEIAREKGGIFKRGVPAVIACDDEEARKTLLELAQSLSAPARVFDRDFSAVRHLPIGLCGEHQTRNAALAIEAVKASGVAVSDDAMKRGLLDVRWPGRMELCAPDVLLDAAHNPDGARALAKALPQVANGRAVTLVIGIVKEKDAAQVLAPLTPLAKRVIFTTPASDRARDPESLRAFLSHGDVTPEVISDPAEAIAVARDGKSLVVITGSIFLIGSARAILTSEPCDPISVQDPSPTKGSKGQSRS